MSDDDLTPEQREGQDTIDQALRSIGDKIGPWGEGRPVDAQWLVSEWVVVISWTHAETGESTLTRACSEGLLTHHRNGLLHEALYGDWSNPEDDDE